MRGRDRQPPAETGQQLPDNFPKATPVTVSPALRPVALRAVEARPIRQSRDRVDQALLLGERLVLAALVVFGAYHVIDGPLRDRWHDRAPAAVAAPRAMPRRPSPVPPRRHPELGRSLPSEAPLAARPATTADYLAPARRFVAAAPPPRPVVAEAAPAPQLDLRPAHLHAAGAGIDAPVVEVFLKNGAWEVADYAAGYLHGTGVAGDGNVVMAGHKGVRGGVFAHLERLRSGDDIFIDAAGRRFHYRVRTTGNVWPSDVGVLYPTPTPTLTLLTCTNWDTQRFVVMADLVDSAELRVSIGG